MARKRKPPATPPFVGREGRGEIQYRDPPRVVAVWCEPIRSHRDWEIDGKPLWIIAQLEQVSQKRQEVVFTRTTIPTYLSLAAVLHVVPNCIKISAGVILPNAHADLLPVTWREVKDITSGTRLAKRWDENSAGVLYWDRQLTPTTVQRYDNPDDPAHPAESPDDDQAEDDDDGGQLGDVA